MDTNVFAVLKLFVVGILAQQQQPLQQFVDSDSEPGVPSSIYEPRTPEWPVNAWMMRGLSATDNIEPTVTRPGICNESRLQWEVEVCGEIFKRDMAHIDPQYWCNLTHFISEYHLFTHCTESKSQMVNCYWPNPLVEGFIIRIHKHFFSNCTTEQVVWVDPPDSTLSVLILIPVFLTLAMIALVVWCSKRSDILA